MLFHKYVLYAVVVSMLMGLGSFIAQYSCSSCSTAMCTKLGASASLMRCRLDLGGLETTFGSLSLRVCSVCMT